VDNKIGLVLLQLPVEIQMHREQKLFLVTESVAAVRVDLSPLALTDLELLPQVLQVLGMDITVPQVPRENLWI
jgi:hypothetical protein